MPALDLSKRLKLLNISDTTIANMRTFHPIVANNIDNLVAEFYRFVHQMPATAAIFRGYDIERHLKPAQKKHWDSLFSGRFDDEYTDQAIRIGTIHYRRKVAPYLVRGADAAERRNRDLGRPARASGDERGAEGASDALLSERRRPASRRPVCQFRALGRNVDPLA